MQIKFDYSGKRAVVTGGAQGIGFQIVHDLLEAGAEVEIWDYAAEALQRAVDELRQYCARITTRQVDVGQFAAVRAAAEARSAPLHLLVNNAGITRDKTFAKMSSDEFEQVVQTNLTGAFHVSKALLDQFAPGDEPKRIINMASVVALYGNFGQVNYAAAKAGLIGMTKSMARELGRKGFTVNAIAPGFISTAMVNAMPQAALDSMTARVPSGRLGTTRDIAAACLFLGSDAASYINGAVLSVDGGVTI